MAIEPERAQASIYLLWPGGSVAAERVPTAQMATLCADVWEGEAEPSQVFEKL
ncbi:MAG: hypothetical protein WKG00_12010 [Polyangiaceae bacterium]